MSGHDEQVVEVMIDGLDYLDQDDAETEARHLLAALRAAGFDVYRPDDCEVDIVFAGEHATGLTFVEVERPDRSSVSVGEWWKRDDDLWCLRVSVVGGDS